jgi:hypothetical protein
MQMVPKQVIAGTPFEAHMLPLLHRVLVPCSIVAIVHVVEQTTSLVHALVVFGRDYWNLDVFRSWVQFCQNNLAIPTVFCMTYFPMVYAFRKTIAKHEDLALVCKRFAAWNLGLSLFSCCWGFWHMAWVMLLVAANGGLQFSICIPKSDLVSAPRTRQPIPPFALLVEDSGVG